jgi:hypothetical protein
VHFGEPALSSTFGNMVIFGNLDGETVGEFFFTKNIISISLTQKDTKRDSCSCYNGTTIKKWC